MAITKGYIDVYNVETIQQGFVNAVIPHPQLIITHLERFLWGALINKVGQSDNSLTLHIQSPTWSKRNYNAMLEFTFAKQSNGNLLITNVYEQQVTEVRTI